MVRLWRAAPGSWVSPGGPLLPFDPPGIKPRSGHSSAPQLEAREARHVRSGSRTNNLRPAIGCTHLITAAPEKSLVQKGGQSVVRGLPSRCMCDMLVESTEMRKSSGQQRLTWFV